MPSVPMVRACCKCGFAVFVSSFGSVLVCCFPCAHGACAGARGICLLRWAVSGFCCHRFCPRGVTLVWTLAGQTSVCTARCLGLSICFGSVVHKFPGCLGGRSGVMLPGCSLDRLRFVRLAVSGRLYAGWLLLRGLRCSPPLRALNWACGCGPRRPGVAANVSYMCDLVIRGLGWWAC